MFVVEFAVKACITKGQELSLSLSLSLSMCDMRAPLSVPSRSSLPSFLLRVPSSCLFPRLIVFVFVAHD